MYLYINLNIVFCVYTRLDNTYKFSNSELYEKHYYTDRNVIVDYEYINFIKMSNLHNIIIH